VALLDRFSGGDIRALSRVISLVENRDEGYRELLSRLYLKSGHAVKLGITGPPGAGKSTLVNRLTRRFLDEGRKVGIVAVDPSSPYTGGALLGDRVRMNEFPGGGSVYFRSMATRGATGGLSAATDNVAVVLDAFGFDIVLIETVGVGQVELDVVDACDSVVVVIVPESGDAVQTMKAGLMEIADIMVVNKADRPGAETMVIDLQHTIKLRKQADDGGKVAVIPTEAVNGRNVDLLYTAIVEHVESAGRSGRFDRHRRGQIRKKILNILKNRFQKEFLDSLGDEFVFEKVVDDIHQHKTDPFTISDRLFEKFSRC